MRARPALTLAESPCRALESGNPGNAALADDGAGEGARNRLWTAELLAWAVEKVGQVSTFVNAFAMNAPLLDAIAELVKRGIVPSISRSSNSPAATTPTSPSDPRQARVKDF